MISSEEKIFASEIIRDFGDGKVECKGFLFKGVPVGSCAAEFMGDEGDGLMNEDVSSVSKLLKEDCTDFCV